jgi:hypothetical protein
MLWYSKVLIEEKRGNKNIYTIWNKNLLEYISIKERNALKFIQLYLVKVLTDSWIYQLFTNFFEAENKQTFDDLKYGFVTFMTDHTSINKETEPRRIFTKVINPLAFLYNKKWTKRWFLSPYSISYDELMYNRLNWRDIWWTKIKWETREEYENRAQIEFVRRRERYTDYSISKAKKIIQKLYAPNSEHLDEYANWEATQVHHIFMKSEFPYLADYVENLILLTWTQHNSKAHPSNNTRLVNKDYQLLLLLSKAENIHRSLEEWEIIYSKTDFIHVLNSWLNTELGNDIPFVDIKSELNNIYQSI